MSIFQTLLHVSPLALLGSGALIGYARNFYAPVKSWVDRKLWISVSAVQPEVAYEELDEWLNVQPGVAKVKNLYMKTFRSDGETYRQLVPGFGDSWFFYGHHLVKVNRTKSEQPGDNAKQIQSINLRFLFGNRKLIEDIFAEGRRISENKNKNRPRLFVWELTGQYSWHEIKQASFRPLSSLSLPDNQAHSLVDKIREFLNSESQYNHLGVPYRHGVLLSGLPGTGKTSLISSIASELKTSVYVVNLTSVTDNRLQYAIGTIPKGSLVVFEDVDTVTPSREKEDRGLGLSLSGLLNVMDGLLSGKGLIFFLTTNYLDKIDPALIRTGRIDSRIEFGYATVEQVRSMFRRFFPDASKSQEEDFVYEHKNTKVTTSDLQEKLFAKLHGREVKSELYEVA